MLQTVNDPQGPDARLHVGRHLPARGRRARARPVSRQAVAAHAHPAEPGHLRRGRDAQDRRSSWTMWTPIRAISRAASRRGRRSSCRSCAARSVLGEIDIDSDKKAAFGPADRELLEVGRGAARAKSFRGHDAIASRSFPATASAPKSRAPSLRVLEAAGLRRRMGGIHRRRRGARRNTARRCPSRSSSRSGRTRSRSRARSRRRSAKASPASTSACARRWPLRQPAPGLEPAVGAVALSERRPRHRAREHRGPLRRARARGRPGRRREPEDHHERGVDAHRALRLRVRAAAQAQARDRRAQGQHHEAERRPVPRVRARVSPATIPRFSTTSASSTRRACTW